jgi:uncharacterized protein (DUF427 family)
VGIRTEPIDKWVRAYVGDTAVVDSRAPLLFYEEHFPVPGYAFSRDDVRTDLLRLATGAPPEKPFFYLPKGPVREWYDVVVGERVVPHAAWVRDDPALTDLLVLTWQPGLLDRWMEEDEEVVEHPRDPHKRVEAIASSRRVQVTLDGVELADSRSPVLLFETGLPTRYYLPREDVRLDLFEPTSNRSRCPYKGTASEWWSVRGMPEASNIAWSYSAPLPAVGKVAGRVAFYNELVDITLDGVAQERPVSVFSRREHRPVT